MSASYNELNPITEEELEDLKKIAQVTTSSTYIDKDGNVISVADVATGKAKVKSGEVFRTGSMSGKVGDPNYGITNVRDAGK
nr:hypothetical protein 55 [bacterium]